MRKKKPTSSRNTPSKMTARPAGMRKSHSSFLMAEKKKHSTTQKHKRIFAKKYTILPETGEKSTHIHTSFHFDSSFLYIKFVGFSPVNHT